MSIKSYKVVEMKEFEPKNLIGKIFRPNRMGAGVLVLNEKEGRKSDMQWQKVMGLIIVSFKTVLSKA